MTDLFEQHRDTLTKALDAIDDRGYWSAYEENPRGYPEDAAQAGEDAFNDRLGNQFELGQPGVEGDVGDEESPYGIELGITYPRSSVPALLEAAETAINPWGRATPEVRAGVCLEILDRLNRAAFEMAQSVMHTTGQGFLMAFQAGSSHALDRGLEAVAYAYREMSRTPTTARWEKPQGKRDPLLVEKSYHIVPRGVAVVIGVSTFPTWNGYPGLFASLVTGNAVIVKPHPETILPLALTVDVARAVLTESGFDPNVVTLAVDTLSEPIAKDLVMDPRVRLVDYTGGSAFGDWLEENVHHALVFTEMAGVNSIVIDGGDDLKGILNNLSVSLSLYSGQMCTTPQNIFVPRDGITVGDDELAFKDVAANIAGAVDKLLGDDARAVEILGSIKSDATLERMEAAAGTGDVALEARDIDHPRFPDARVRTPVIVKVDAADEDAYMAERFGPITYVIATDDTAHSLELATKSARQRGALTWLVYSNDDSVLQAAEEAALSAGVSLSVNLTGGVYVNQNAAFSDFHVTGANPAGNASLTDPAFVANRFRVVQVRKPVEA